VDVIGLSIPILLSVYDSNESIDFVHGKSIFFIEVLDELELFIYKKVISVGPPPPSVSKFCDPHNFFFLST
jgi:hypothetical protein